MIDPDCEAKITYTTIASTTPLHVQYVFEIRIYHKYTVYPQLCFRYTKIQCTMYFSVSGPNTLNTQCIYSTVRLGGYTSNFKVS